MSKVPLKQLSVNTFESNRNLPPTSPTKKNATVTTNTQSVKKTSVACKQLINIEEVKHDISSIVQAGLQMSTSQFDTFVEKTAPESYWQIMAEYYRNKLEDVTRENQQLHDIVDGLNRDNENLRVIADHCEYLTDIIEKLTSENESEIANKSTISTDLF